MIRFYIEDENDWVIEHYNSDMEFRDSFEYNELEAYVPADLLGYIQSEIKRGRGNINPQKDTKSS
jgi:hypothetical protein